MTTANQRRRPHYTLQVSKVLDWQQIDHVLLDMDGTLLDLRFDTEFWLQHLPARYAAAEGLTVEEALRRIRARMEAMSGKLAWYCIDEWSKALGVSVADLHRELAGGIGYRDTAVAFLEGLAASDKQALIVTNAHPETVDIKLHRTGLGRYVDAVVSSHDYGAAKEHDEFWQTLDARHVFDRGRTLLIDDNLSVLRAAHRFGIAHLLAVSHPDSSRGLKDTGEFEAIRWFTEILPIR